MRNPWKEKQAHELIHAMLEPIHARIEEGKALVKPVHELLGNLACELRKALLELRVEPREVQFVLLTKLGSGRRNHLIHHLHQFIDELLPEALMRTVSTT